MPKPRMKRIKISTEQELRNFLAKKSGPQQDVMIVTCSAKSRDKHISSEQVRDAARDNGWNPGRSYTLDGNLVGHVVSHT